MEFKVIIEDLVAHHEGEQEQELPKGTTIRFEIDYKDYIAKYTVNATHYGLEIYKVAHGVLGKDEIAISPKGSNKIFVK